MGLLLRRYLCAVPRLSLIRRSKQLLVSTARAMGVTKIILGDSASLLAVRALAHVALGRGASIPQDIVSLQASRLLLLQGVEQQPLFPTTLRSS